MSGARSRQLLVDLTSEEIRTRLSRRQINLTYFKNVSINLKPHTWCPHRSQQCILCESCFLATCQHLGQRCAAWGGRLIEANGEHDHVHLLIELPPTAALADFVNALKTGTSRRLRAMFAQELAGVYSKPVLWSRSYCMLSCGGAPLEIIKQYIQQQDRPDD
jgi:putative transposase